MRTQSHITVILDRTGSMESIRDDVIGGFNSFLYQQLARPEAASVTLVQFDSQEPYQVLHKLAPIDKVRPLDRETYSPRACTPLYDAIGRGILDLEAGLAAMPDAERPPHVVFVIVTDGQENASRDFDRTRVSRLIGAKKKLGWQFIFLSADLEAFVDAGRFGVEADSRMHFSKNKQGNDAAWASLSEKLSDFRSGRADKVAFDDKDRSAAPRR